MQWPAPGLNDWTPAETRLKTSDTPIQCAVIGWLYIENSRGHHLIITAQWSVSIIGACMFSTHYKGDDDIIPCGMAVMLSVYKPQFENMGETVWNLRTQTPESIWQWPLQPNHGQRSDGEQMHWATPAMALPIVNDIDRLNKTNVGQWKPRKRCYPDPCPSLGVLDLEGRERVGDEEYPPTLSGAQTSDGHDVVNGGCWGSAWKRLTDMSYIMQRCCSNMFHDDIGASSKLSHLERCTSRICDGFLASINVAQWHSLPGEGQKHEQFIGGIGI